jgi:hypothetical protein
MVDEKDIVLKHQSMASAAHASRCRTRLPL